MNKAARLIGYYILPTLIGWVVGSLTCVSLMCILDKELPTFRDILNIWLTAGIFITAPTFLFCVLPYLAFQLHWLRTAKIKEQCRFFIFPLVLLLVLIGGVITFVPPSMLIGRGGENLSLTSSLPPRNPLLWLIPFIPYSLVLGFVARAFFRSIQKHDY